MTSQQIRETFLEYFARRGHRIVPSSSLLPKDDPTILFANAGMNQFKSVFLGLEKPATKRAVSVQKCLRVSGKHNDLDTVGRTAKHHTFFEMLGNFSFGDYFKEEAIAFAWELVTGVLAVRADRLYATVYLEDDVAFRLWNEKIGLPPDRIFRYGKKDNFWAMGDTGPCGPCSELHYDLGADIEAGKPEALIEAGSDRFVELWNLVFMEFLQDERGLRPLPAPSIDTGMGLERMAAVLQGKRSNYDTDLFSPLIESVCESTRREYPAGDDGDVAVRIIADHVRAVAFLVADGVSPANDGRGYVLRRLIRRAFRQGQRLGLEKPFLYALIGRVADIMKDAYPEILASVPYVSRVTLAEEERFAATLASGLRVFDEYVRETRAAGGRVLPGDRAFKLYDTFGFPLDLTRELAREQALEVDEPGFERELEGQRSRARQSWKGDLKQKEKLAYEALKDLHVRSRVHDGAASLEAEVLAVVQDGDRRLESLGPGEEGEIVLDETPFYAEAGGQVGDTGVLKSSRASAVVSNAYYVTPEVVAHNVRILSGSIKPGDRIEAVPDLIRRAAVSANHTATHLLHAALRQVLGDHVRQAGSLVSAKRLRFDFSHFAALSPEEIRRVEDLVNEKIRADLDVTTRVTSLEEGIREGAMAIFEEKYGEQVRLVGIEGISKELCGGVHAPATGRIGLFKILSESSIAAGMRRIEAVTGEEALREFQQLAADLAVFEESLGAARREILPRLEKLKDGQARLERENKALRKKLADRDSAGAGEDVRTVKGLSLIARRVEGLDAAGLRDLADKLKQKLGSGVVILGQAEAGKAAVVVAVSRDLTGRVKAGALVKELAVRLGGGGGGRPDFAQAGGSRPEELDRTLEESAAILEKML